MKENKHVKLYKEKHLSSDETILASVEAFPKKINVSGAGALIVTEKSVVFYRKGLTSETIKSIPRDAITSVDNQSKLLSTLTTIRTASDALIMECMDKKECQILLDVLNNKNVPASQKAIQDEAIEEKPTPTQSKETKQPKKNSKLTERLQMILGGFVVLLVLGWLFGEGPAENTTNTPTNTPASQSTPEPAVTPTDLTVTDKQNTLQSFELILTEIKEKQDNLQQTIGNNVVSRGDEYSVFIAGWNRDTQQWEKTVSSKYKDILGSGIKAPFCSQAAFQTRLSIANIKRLGIGYAFNDYSVQEGQLKESLQKASQAIADCSQTL